MKDTRRAKNSSVNRRSFLKKGVLAAGAATVSAGLLGRSLPTFGEEKSGNLPPGDAGILRFLAAAEIIESDLWQQYAELGGVQDNEIPGLPTGGNPLYTAALQLLDGDMPQYVHDNTDDEFSHQSFINAYLASKGADTVDLSHFATIPGSTAMGSSGKKRLTNLMELNVDTSFWTRYRIDNENPDLDPNFVFPQAVEIKNRTAIPRDDSDTVGSFIDNQGVLHATDHLKAIAFTAGFHFAFIEQGGTSLYAAMTRKATADETKKITLGIGGDEIAHFLEWVDFAGNGVQAPVAPLTDTILNLTFPNFFSPLNPSIQPSLIFPVPAEFISPDLPRCATIRPLTDKFAGARAAVKGLTASGLFIGQTKDFFKALQTLAEEADAAVRKC